MCVCVCVIYNHLLISLLKVFVWGLSFIDLSSVSGVCVCFISLLELFLC